MIRAFENCEKWIFALLQPSVYLSVRLFVCLSVRLSLCPSVCLSVRPSVCPSVCLSFCLSVCLSVWKIEQLGSQLKNFHEIRYTRIFFTSVDKILVSIQYDKNKDILHENLCTFMIICRWTVLRIRNASDKSWWENQNTHFMFSNLFFRHSCNLRDTVEKYGRSKQAIIRRMRIACWITTATDTNSEYVKLTAFPRQQWLR